MRILRSTIAAVAGATALALTQAGSQTPGSRAAFMVEQQVRERWMHGRQQSRFSPFAFDRSWLSVDSLRTADDRRRVSLTLARSVDGQDAATIAVDRRGRITELHVRPAPASRRAPTVLRDSAQVAEQRRRRLVLAEARLWELIPTFPPDAPRIGLSWTDTIAFSAGDGPVRQSLRGTRFSRVVRDTVVGGLRLWVVRDSAAVDYEERYLEMERTLDAMVRITRTAGGTLRGAHLYDPDRHLFRSREDTTRLAGEAVLRYPDGRSFRTPARYERVRRVDLLDSTAYSARLAELRAADRRAYGGMVMVPANELQRRLADGDVVARDSLLGVWRRTSDPDEATRLLSLLMRWGARSEASRDSLDRVRIAAGDTAHLYQTLANRAYTTVRPPDTADVRAMIAFMQDPSLAWGFNISRDWLYENLVQALSTSPRAAAVGSDNASVSCTVPACRLLGEQWRSAREPRLRDVGLVALMSLDPRRWADTVLALYGPRRPLLRPAAMLAKGVGVRSTWPPAPNAPLPPPNSEWRVWVDWMNGVDSSSATTTAATTPVRSTTARVRFENSHGTAIRFYTARTGRDVVGELRRRVDAAPSDSAWFVFATMLHGLGELRFTDAEVASAFTSGVPERVALAQRVLISQLWRSSEPMAAAAAMPLLERVLAAVVDGTRLWRAGVVSLRGDMGNLPGVHGPVGRRFVESDSLPSALRAKWGGRVEIVSAAEWRNRDPRVGGVLFRLSPVRSWGRFARVEVTLSERLTRPEGEAPAQYAAGATYYLLELNGEWVVVAQEAWIT